MIFSTLNQVNCFLIFLFFGFICNFVINILSIIFLKKFKKLTINCVFDCIFTIFLCIFLIFLLINFNFGKFSIVLIITFLFGYCTTQFVFKKTFVFLENKWYNTINKFLKGLKSRHEHKSKKS